MYFTSFCEVTTEKGNVIHHYIPRNSCPTLIKLNAILIYEPCEAPRIRQTILITLRSVQPMWSHGTAEELISR